MKRRSHSRVRAAAGDAVVLVRYLLFVGIGILALRYGVELLNF